MLWVAVPALAASPAATASLAVSLVGELGRLRLAIGSAIPSSRGGTSSKTPVGNSRMSERIPGVFANMVTESRSGMTRIRNSAGKFVCLLGGSRERRAE